MKTRFLIVKVHFSAVILNVVSAANGQTANGVLGTLLYRRSLVWTVFYLMRLIQGMLKYSKSLFTGDLEFFHDKGGLTNYEHTIEFHEDNRKKAMIN